MTIHMDQKELEQYLRQDYQGSKSFLENILFPIFGENENGNEYETEALDENAQSDVSKKSGISSIKRIWKFFAGVDVEFLDITVSDRVKMEKNRSNVQDTVIKGMGPYTMAFMIFHYEKRQGRDWRFSFCEIGGNIKDRTDYKRYTFQLGPGQSCRTAAENFFKLIKKKGKIVDTDIKEAFSVQAVSDDFFKDYKEVYDDIVEYIIGKRFKKIKNRWVEEKKHEPCAEIYNQFLNFGDADKAVRDYVKKLMGRLVFLQFLQKKGWMGVPASKEWGDGDKQFIQNLYAKSPYQDNFIEAVLEPIFQDINTKRENDLATNPNVGIGILLPYLNGGLFEPDKADKTTIVLPKTYIEEILDFFGRYNFTIDEDDPYEREVGVDPEMLSRIFENLLEDNKDKGAFYTPKPKVEYMCRESLIAYLQTYVENKDKGAIRMFVTTHKKDALSQVSANIDQLLRRVKICDPAIGSGAFPMGMLKELYLCRMALEDGKGVRPADIKREIIQNNIYGVDFERGAIDIARLRFWLALVVDEETPETLPNLDFKIMQGNSLLESYEGIDLSRLSVMSDLQIYEPQRNLWGEIENPQLKIAFTQSNELRDFQENLHKYFTVNNHAERLQLRKAIEDYLRKTIKQTLERYERGEEKSVESIVNLNRTLNDKQKKAVKEGEKEIDHYKKVINDVPQMEMTNSRFFLWHTWFSDVFDNGGFDIVITNPPYFVYEGDNKEELSTLKQTKYLSPSFGGKLNAYKVFLALTLNVLLKDNAICCMIFQNSFLADRQAAKLRKFVLENTQLLRIDSYPERDNKQKRVFKDVKMSVCIVLMRKVKTHEKFELNVWDDKDETSGTHSHLSINDIIALSPKDYTIPRIDDNSLKVVISMLAANSNLSVKCYEGELNVTEHKKYFCNNSALPIILKGAAIQRYYFTLNMSQGSIEYLREKEYLQDCGKSEKSHHHEFRRIVMQGMTGANDKVRLIMSIVPAGYYLGHSCKYILPIDELSLEFLLGFYNSKAANWFFRRFSTNSNVNGYEVENIPIPTFSDVDKEKIEQLVVTVEKKKRSGVPTRTEEDAIDELVYAAYNLNPEEINIIENS